MTRTDAIGWQESSECFVSSQALLTLRTLLQLPGTPHMKDLAILAPLYLKKLAQVWESWFDFENTTCRKIVSQEIAACYKDIVKNIHTFDRWNSLEEVAAWTPEDLMTDTVITKTVEWKPKKDLFYTGRNAQGQSLIGGGFRFQDQEGYPLSILHEDFEFLGSQCTIDWCETLAAALSHPEDGIEKYRTLVKELPLWLTPENATHITTRFEHLCGIWWATHKFETIDMMALNLLQYKQQHVMTMKEWIRQLTHV